MNKLHGLPKQRHELIDEDVSNTFQLPCQTSFKAQAPCTTQGLPQGIQ